MKDFRSKDGIYNLHSKYGTSYEEMLSHTYFFRHTETFYEFYREFMINTSAKPNAAHKFLAELEKKKHVTVVTQNIDGLHQMAGSKNVLELHGSIHRNSCLSCYEKYSLEDILKMDTVPKCPRCGGLIKPDVTLYEESLDMDVLNEAVYQIAHADLMIIAGTSLRVYPASGLIHYYNGKHLVVINKEPLDVRSDDLLEINGPVGEVFSKLHI
ncbi:MAG: NAD-dependent protein deacylase [Bacteroidales bacterium]|nr:NAD-dependent protein deacylase [Bacteroidales bacterium]